MKVSVIGSGYVGLVTGVCLAEKGHTVVCLDVDEEKVESINRGTPSIHEPGLPELLRKNCGTRLRATTDLHRAVLETDLSVIAVGTPFADGEIDLTYVKDAARQVGESLRAKATYHTVVVKSTVVPGTTDEVVLPILEKASGKKAGQGFGVGMNPEFLTEGEAVHDFMHPDRIVLGASDARSLAALEELYAGFEGTDRISTSTRTAEMIKYASNCLLATMISFSNEIGNLCAVLGHIDVVDVMEGVHLSQYLRPALRGGERVLAPLSAFLWAGCGFGGSCLPKDVRALIAHGRKAGQPMSLLESVIQVNQGQHQRVLGLLKKHFPSLKGVRVAVLGLAFRPDTSDMRESPAIPIINALLDEQAVLKAYDPAAREEARKIFPNGKVRLCENLAQAVEDTQAIVVVTGWDEFRKLPEVLKNRQPQPLVVDGRRMLEKDSLARYEGIGL
jgi:UDPglucose 6-dehydrogenase